MTSHFISRLPRHPLRTAVAGVLAGLSLAAVAAGPAADVAFAQKAAMGGMAEVEAGTLAREKGSSDKVKQFGMHMTEDHAKTNDELKALAATKGMTLPAAPDAAHRQAKAKLEAQSGPAFDRAYRTQMLDDHKKTIALFETEARSGQDAEMKAFAQKTLPGLREHLKMAQAL